MRAAMIGACALLVSIHGAASAEPPVQACPAPAVAAPDLDVLDGQPPSVLRAVAEANDAARQRPHAAGFAAARQIYTYAPGALYILHANPLFVSTILLEPGESLVDVAAGDTSRWMVTETVAEAEAEPRTIVLVKPQAHDLRTNIVLVTDRRTYLVEAISQAGDAYLAQIAWCYPARLTQPAADPVAALRFDYRLRTTRGRKPAWFPTRVYDDGGRTWIEFPPQTAASDLPPLFVITPEGAELANYRVLEGPLRLMVDRIFETAELRMGLRNQVIVRIERASPPRVVRRGGRP